MKKIKIEGIGFNPLKDYESWRVAQLSYCEEINSIEGINQLGRHKETDEVFILLEDEAIMVTAGTEEVPGEFNIYSIEKGSIIVVEKNEWHAAILNPDTRLLIVENKNTNDQNSNIYKLTEQDKERLNKLCGSKKDI